MRGRLSAIGLSAALVLGGLVGLAPGTATAAAAVAPAGQVVTVSAANSTTTWATVDVWQLQPDGRYFRVQHYPDARIGAAGIGAAAEGVSRTPAGLFRLGQAFGVQPNPGLDVPYFQAGLNDVWTGSTGSVINEHRVCAPYTCPASYGAFERLINYPQQYAYGAVIGYNMSPTYGTGAVAGKGSAFFLHVQNAYATGGCVAVNQARLLWILRWMRAAQNPVISLGIGVTPYNVIPNRYH
jgi:L,D-peptidoglycan transpeptidase YkuD (ErfK/YbiS/YcfS/YnhG family)